MNKDCGIVKRLLNDQRLIVVLFYSLVVALTIPLFAVVLVWDWAYYSPGEWHWVFRFGYVIILVVSTLSVIAEEYNWD